MDNLLKETVNFEQRFSINQRSHGNDVSYLTDREAQAVLCSVVKHAGSGWSTKKAWGETRDVVLRFSPNS